MSSYNRVQGPYVADSCRLIEDVLRNEWGFKGTVISDWMGVYSTVESINAGLDIEMPGPPKWRGEKLLRAIKDGKVTEATIGTSARRVLKLARRLGCFAHPDEPKEVALDNPDRDRFIQDSAAQGMVVLKNEGEVLPIPRDASVALIGRHAFYPSLGGGGSARVDSIRAISPAEGLKAAGFKTMECPGVPVFGAVPHADPLMILESSSQSRVGRPVKLEWFNGSVIGENLAHEEMVEFPEYMIKEKWPDYLNKEYCTRITFDLRPGVTGDHLLSVVSTGRAVCHINGVKAFERLQETDLHPESFYFFKSKLERRFECHMKANKAYHIVLESWNTDPELLKADHLKDRMFQGSALRFHEHIDIRQRLDEACAAARSCDYAVVCVGTTVEIESEGFDRDTMDLSELQYQQIAEIAAQNPKTIVVNFSGGPVTLTPFVNSVAGIVQAWFPGQECGHSLASVLSGEVNPSGCLPFSWPRANEDNPAFANFPCDSGLLLKYGEGLDVGYRYYDKPHAPEALFPFGHGLSYTSFSLSGFHVSQPHISSVNDSLTISCMVKNTGKRPGHVVVQFYVSYPDSAEGSERPLKELKDFQKVSVEPGEEVSVSSMLDKYSVSWYNTNEECWQADAGEYKVMAGLSCQEIHGEATFELSEGFQWRGI